MLQRKSGTGIPPAKTPSPSFACCCDSLRTCCRNEERHLDRPRRAVSCRMQHLKHAALPLGLLATQQRLEDADVLAHARPLHRPLSKRESTRESRSYPDGYPLRSRQSRPKLRSLPRLPSDDADSEQGRRGPDRSGWFSPRRGRVAPRRRDIALASRKTMLCCSRGSRLRVHARGLSSRSRMRMTM